MYVYMYVHVLVYMCTCMCERLHIKMYIHVRVRVHTCTCTCTWTIPLQVLYQSDTRYLTGYFCDPELCVIWPKNGNLQCTCRWILFMHGSTWKYCYYYLTIDIIMRIIFVQFQFHSHNRINIMLR